MEQPNLPVNDLPAGQLLAPYGGWANRNNDLGGTMPDFSEFADDAKKFADEHDQQNQG
jgi:hypothetical protein